MSPHTHGELSSQAEVEARLTDLHYAIFERLPDAGRMLGWTPMAETVKHLRDQLNADLPNEAPKLTSGMLQAELRNLAVHGLTIKALNISGNIIGWQRTKRAVELMAERKEHAAAVARARAENEAISARHENEVSS